MAPPAGHRGAAPRHENPEVARAVIRVYHARMSDSSVPVMGGVQPRQEAWRRRQLPGTGLRGGRLRYPGLPDWRAMALVCVLALTFAPLAGCERNDERSGNGAPADHHEAAAHASRRPGAEAARAPRDPQAPSAPGDTSVVPGHGAVGTESARVALVIDDLGQRLGGPVDAILGLPVPLTLAVLPGLPRSREVAALATSSTATAGSTAVGPARELFLHLPMQPVDYPATDPGPDALLVGLEAGEVVARLDRALAAVPGARGVNNHMGSAATADPVLMTVLMDALRARELRFLDSLTTPHSIAWRTARAAGVPCLRNRLFLDAEPADEAAIAARLAELVAIARRTGQAVGIGHPHPATAAVLAREVPRYVAEGVRFVTVSELMAVPAAVEQATVAGGADAR